MNISENFSINKKQSAFPKIIIGIFLLVFFIMLLNFFNAPTKNFFFTVSSPIQKTFWSAGESSSGFLSSVINAGDLSKENDNLKNENQKLISEITSLQAINDANQAQSNVSQACQNTNFKLLMAGVIGLDGQDELTINKGSVDGVAENMPVINQQNVVFGKIDKVYKNFSQVMLVSNKKSIINVKIGDINGVIKGSGNQSFYLDLVPVNSNLNKGDVLTTSALEKTFPKDLLVGTVLQIQKNDQKPFLQAQVQPFFNLSNADNLFVITNYKQAQ